VRDDVAQRFTKNFYQRIRDGSSIKTSFELAAKQISVHDGASEAEQFKLLPEGASHDISFAVNPGEMVDYSPPAPLWVNQQCQVSGMIGRSHEYDVYKFIHNHLQNEKNVVVISGKPLSGKSEVSCCTFVFSTFYCCSLSK
jgi:hypothetical protein